MSKITSSRQHTANRKNAKKPTGSRSKSGKARSATDALKPGLLAKTISLATTQTGESKAEFDQLLADLFREFKPAALIERTLVERIATCLWRLARAHRVEAGLINEGLEKLESDNSDIERIRSAFNKAEKALHIETKLAALLKKPVSELTSDELKALEESLADFTRAYGPFRDEARSPRDNAERELPRILATAESKVARLKSELAACEEAEDSRTKTQALTSALPQSDQILRVIRYETMLDRQIHRALTELRRLRSTRRKRSSTR